MIMFILFLLDDKVQIARIHPRLLVRHALERDGLPRIHPLREVYRELDLLGLGLPVRAVATVRLPHLPRRHAPLVALLYLLDEPGSDLLHPYLDAGSLTLLVGFHAFLPLHAEYLSDVLHLDGVA